MQSLFAIYCFNIIFCKHQLLVLENEINRPEMKREQKRPHASVTVHSYVASSVINIRLNRDLCRPAGAEFLTPGMLSHSKTLARDLPIISFSLDQPCIRFAPSFYLC